jgi:hypothetical protein
MREFEQRKIGTRRNRYRNNNYKNIEDVMGKSQGYDRDRRHSWKKVWILPMPFLHPAKV